jgi:hypothetical protein
VGQSDVSSPAAQEAMNKKRGEMVFRFFQSFTRSRRKAEDVAHEC